MVVPEGVDYEAFDGSLAHLIFMIAAPEGEADVHLEALSSFLPFSWTRILKVI